MDGLGFRKWVKYFFRGAFLLKSKVWFLSYSVNFAEVIGLKTLLLSFLAKSSKMAASCLRSFTVIVHFDKMEKNTHLFMFL